MKIKMRTLSCGPDGTMHPDKVYEVAKKDAEELIKGGFAVAVDEDKKPEDKKPEDKK